jgi:hypothetical protein
MSFLATLRAGPPPPKVALLPDGVFFTRSLPVAAGATPAEAAAQIELALEGVSPFPVTQLFFGYYWVPGAETAFVFAAYRRRFTAEQMGLWAGAELVLPAFAALLAAEVKPATTVILASADGLTALHWGASAVPALALFRPFPIVVEGTPEAEPEKIEEARARVREELIRDVGGSHAVVDLSNLPAADPARSDGEITFRVDHLVSRFDSRVVHALDVRDKGELASLRGARRRDVILWRVAMGCVAALALLVVGEAALWGGGMWQKERMKKFTLQKPLVDNIMTSDALARRIDDLANKRLLPWEMIMGIIGESRDRLPREIYFTRVYTLPTKGIYTLLIEGQTTNISTMPGFKAMLKGLPDVENVEGAEQVRGEAATFTLTVTFKPGAIKPGARL